MAVIGTRLAEVAGSLSANSPARAALGEVTTAAGNLRVLAAQLAAYTHEDPQSAEPIEITGLLARRKRQIERSLGEGIHLDMILFPAKMGVQAGPAQLAGGRGFEPGQHVKQSRFP